MSEEQDWRGIDGAAAWHLIDRKAENWSEVGLLMDAWRVANQPASESESAIMLSFVLANGLPMNRDGLYRYHGVKKIVWHSTAMEAIKAAMKDAQEV